MDARDIAAGRERWQARYDASVRRDADFTTLSGLDVDPVYGPAEGAVVPGFERIGWPGEYPYTRGLYPTGYRCGVSGCAAGCPHCAGTAWRPGRRATSGSRPRRLPDAPPPARCRRPVPEVDGARGRSSR